MFIIQGDFMDKQEFDKLEPLEQLEYINNKLKEDYSVTTICKNIGISRSALKDRFTKIEYVFNTLTKQYSKDNTIDIKPSQEDYKLDIKPIEEAVDRLDNRLDYKLDQRLVFSIKNKSKTKTKAFNVVMDKALVEKLDYVCKRKGGYSRNELINKMCQWCIDHMGE